ncbi:hypothetical protein HDV04_006146 [Boothiomyces sp. JEL0838]|nr:hypothetical protein HDV04_006126 [Boothiomyces sp. JEL0838]KAJ3314607.1 hypothetical protein HDV04_006146 [Boothiomyces sp. JEL0838]
MTDFDFTEHSHKRYNPLNDSWILCSPHRAKRPWLGMQWLIEGQQESTNDQQSPSYLPDCFLCPGNKRINGEQNPKYESTFVFANDFPAVKDQQPEYDPNSIQIENVPKDLVNRLYKAQGVRGCAKVVCFSPDHSKTMAEMNADEIVEIVKTWKNLALELKEMPNINYAVMFENKGSAMGCSNPHPHGQVWATEDVPQEPAAEIKSLKKYQNEHHSCLLCDLVKTELAFKDRIVCQNDSWICIVPFWAIWPFETLLLPKEHVNSIDTISEQQQKGLAALLSEITCKYDNLFETSFPYSMGLHGAPLKEENSPMHLHLHFYPPLLRSATVKKFLVGFEMLGQPQRDLTAEQAAKRLRDLPTVHYKLSRK